MPVRTQILALLWAFLSSTGALGTDLFSGIESHRLENGLEVILAPSSSARTVEAEMRVHAGWGTEGESVMGVAQLTQHVLFRDSNLRFSQSYLQRIQDSGGEATGKTEESSTSIFLSVPSIKGIWMLNEISNIFMYRKFTNDEVQKAKRELLLKLGEPNNLLQRLFGNLIPSLSKTPNFMETEFGVTTEDTRDPDRLRKSIKELTQDDVQTFYDKYYHTNNMSLFLAGPYKKDVTLKFISETFEQFKPSVETFPRHVERKVYPRREAYLRSKVASRDSKISIGTKFWDITAEEEIVLKIYFEYLAHRIMKELRTEFGDTYRAKSNIWVGPERFGYVTVTFNTPRVQYKKNLEYVKRLLHKETMEGDFTDADINAAREFYLRYVSLVENDPVTMLSLAGKLYEFQEKYKTQETPAHIYEGLTNEAFRQYLRGIFHPRKAYLSVEEPPLFFRGESIILYLIAITIAIILAQRFYLNDFENTRIRYVKKIRYSPVVILALTLGFFNLIWLVGQASNLIDNILLGWNLFQSTFVLSQYLQGAISVLLVVLASLSYLCLIPRKVIVTDRHLYIKSLSYASRKVDIQKVRDVFICRPQNLFSHRLFNWRVRMIHWIPWKRGILIRLHDGSGYYLSFSNTQQVAQELREVLKTRPNLVIHDAA